MKRELLVFMLLIAICIKGLAQESIQKYKRSSLWTLMIDKPEQKFDSVILDAFSTYPIPEKFNDHNGSLRLIAGISEMENFGKEPNVTKMGLGLLGKIKGAGKASKEGSTGKSSMIDQFMKDSGIARKIVAKWFNRSEKGGFNMNLVADRGSYNASDIDIKIAKSSERGLALVRDAGEQLIQNTFVVVNDFKFTSKEEVARKARGLLSVASSVASYAGNSSLSLATEGASLGVGVVGVPALAELDGVELVAHALGPVRGRFRGAGDQLVGEAGPLRFAGCHALLRSSGAG